MCIGSWVNVSLLLFIATFHLVALILEVLQKNYAMLGTAKLAVDLLIFLSAE